jgi:hypothetical protein
MAPSPGISRAGFLRMCTSRVTGGNAPDIGWPPVPGQRSSNGRSVLGDAHRLTSVEFELLRPQSAARSANCNQHEPVLPSSNLPNRLHCHCYEVP